MTPFTPTSAHGLALAARATSENAALAGQAETWRRERDEARAHCKTLADQRERWLEDLRVASEAADQELTATTARADTLVREVKAKNARIAELGEALTPFAEAGKWISSSEPDAMPAFSVDRSVRVKGTCTTITLSDLRRAARLAPAANSPSTGPAE